MRPAVRARMGLLAANVLAAAVLSLTACSGSSAGAPGSSAPARHESTIRVPQDAKTISAAVAKAQPGDLVLVSAGVYHEQVQVKAARVTIRGLDRNGVIVDGDVLRANGIVLLGDGDAVQNLTVRNATLNGVLVTGAKDASGNGIAKGSDGYSRQNFTPLRGFLVDHVTSYNNGLYGVYAFAAQNGLITDTYTSGMPDSGLYVGQCKPCGIAVRNNVAERNAVGYEGTNASGAVYVIGNRFVGNRVGATTNSDHQEAFVPQEGAVIAGNLIAANAEAKTPEQADGGFGIGFGIAGGTHNELIANRIEANPVAGVEVVNADDLPPVENQVMRNAFAANGVDFVYAASAAVPGRDNCLQGNTLTTVRPKEFPTSCPTTSTPTPAAAPKITAPAGIAFTDVAAPPRQPNLADAATAPAPTTSGLPGPSGVEAVSVPAATLLQDRSSVRW